MSVKKIIGLAALSALGLFASAPASAVSVTWNGADFTVQYQATVNPLVFRFTYIADFDGFTLTATRPDITGINFKLSGADPTAASLIAAPGLDSNWTIAMDSNLNASSAGCGSPNGNNAFICSGINVGGGVLPSTYPTSGSPAPVYTWVIDVTFAAAPTSAMLNAVDNPIRAQFLTNRGGYVQMSETGQFETDTDTDTDTDVPEPGTLALLGLGLIGIGALRRRKA